MNIEDALLIGDLTEGTVIAGDKGLSREIASIEVMEVPEVISWVTPGILVMTAFYSIKDDSDKQIEILQTLINKGAAGIVIKLGRFINSLPDSMIELANKNAFPIISIPKEVSYINILTPLYEKLYEEKQQEQEKSHNPFHEMEHANTKFLSDAIEKISEIVNSSIYIEDTEGRLLYISNNFRPDGWRKSKTLFSKPDYQSYLKMLEIWRVEFLNQTYTLFKIPGFRNRLVLPLISSDKVFAIIHIQYMNPKYDEVPFVHAKKLGNKLSELFMSDQLYLQKKRLNDMELIEHYLADMKANETSEVMAIIHFHADWLKNSHYPSQFLIDHSCLIRKELLQLAEHFRENDLFIFERYHKFYALITCEKQNYPTMVHKWKELLSNYNQRNDLDPLKLSISSIMNDSTFFEERVQSVTKTMEIGNKVKPSENFYTYDQLGIYEILINLTSDEYAKRYTDSILNSLLQYENNDLLETLQVYLDENGNITKASEILFIHRRTLTYRLQKIQELLNMDINDPNNRFILRFCLKFKELS
ncbi:PucR family transcriptional regulator [Virgibacillus oceani]|uniref:PucR family transcriptional regulator n=1 Tax=Virgibacillus oceani TaxID=1479511 RepID=A0A917HH70_9BACI|nr:PucR family transcriptional regulator [Virgibacillus oceani]GGG79591.1 hypothetical protein GCM10011398_26160 [Virgibacillus oceani]